MVNPGWPPPGAPAPAACFRHPDRPSGLHCARCGRPACPECLRDAPVGFHCVSCLAQGQRTVRTARTVAGARVGNGPATPMLTYGLIGANVAVFLLTAALAGSITANSASTTFSDLALLVAAIGPDGPVGVADGQLWRLVSSGFLHYGPLHLALNMYALWILGRDLEGVLGRLRYAALYAVALLGGSTAVVLLEQPNTFTAGASGAVFGLLGALAVVLLKLRRSATPVFTVIAINVAVSIFVPGISLWGHLGGLVTGAAVAGVLLYAPRRRQGLVQAVGVGVVLAVLLAVLVVRLLSLRTELGL